MDIKILKSRENNLGAAYTLVIDSEKITTHFCSHDGFAYSDLFGHKETKEALGEISLEEFRKIPIIPSGQEAVMQDFVKITTTKKKNFTIYKVNDII